MKLFNGIFFLIAIPFAMPVSSFELADYSYICFSHDAVFSKKAEMIQSLRCVNTVGLEHLDQIKYADDGTWSAILNSYEVNIEVFGKTAELRSYQ